MLAGIGAREAHRAMKIWRALWVVCGALNLCDPSFDPSKGIRRVTPKGRSETWTEGEIVRLAKAAWRKDYRGLAVIIAVAWDTGFSPVDVRRLCGADRSVEGFRIPRAKTGKAAIGTICKRTRALINTYLECRKDEIPSAPLFRNRSGSPYSKDTLGDDFRFIRETVFPGDARKLMDVRRSVAVEALAGGAKADQIGGKLANSISTNKELEATYLPQNDAVVRLVDDARRVGRRNIRGTKV
jgi:integrase